MFGLQARMLKKISAGEDSHLPIYNTQEEQMNTHTFRLLPGQDLKKSIDDFVNSQRIAAGSILTCVGSLTRAVIRFANRPEGTLVEGYFEIVSLAGTVGMTGSHLHLSISDGHGKMLGGHLLDGCLVYTTAEIVLASFPELVFRREMCEQSGYPELVIYTVQEMGKERKTSEKTESE